MTDSSGAATFSLPASPAVEVGHYVAALSAVPDRTSEFSMCLREDAACPLPPSRVLTNGQIVGSQSFTACETITTNGEFVIGLFSSAQLRAGESVALGDGFQSFGDFSVEIDAGLLP